MPDREPCVKFKREEVHAPHRWSTPGKSFAAGAMYHDCPGWNHKTKFACRFCQHSLGEHNNDVGCPHCACMGNQSEGSPRTDAELDQKVLPPGATLPKYVRKSNQESVMRFMSKDTKINAAVDATAEAVTKVEVGTVAVNVEHLRVLRNAAMDLYGPKSGASIQTEPPYPGSVWAVVDRDHTESITSVHQTEIDALRVLNGRGHGRVVELPWGKSLADLVSQR